MIFKLSSNLSHSLILYRAFWRLFNDVVSACCRSFPAQWWCPDIWKSSMKSDALPHNLTAVNIYLFNEIWESFCCCYSIPSTTFNTLIWVIVPVTKVHYALYYCTACSIDIIGPFCKYCHFLSVFIMHKICMFVQPNDYCGEEISHPAKCCHSGYSLTLQRN